MSWVIAIPVLPALAFVLLLPLSRKFRNKMLWLPITGIAVSAILSIVAFLKVWPGGEEAIQEPIFHVFAPIAHVGGSALGAGVLLDPVSAAMLVVVTVVGLCVQIYSLSYMHSDERRGWYYTVLSLFTAAMLGLVVADNFLQLYGMWEVMGLCSYLLIGFWHEEEGPRKASIKAFLTTRVGDIGFALGLAAMFTATHSFSFAVVLPAAAHWAPGVATVVALGLLFGAMGKSAQVPLHVWLPDAMAGPTPASALIHAATMVAAGVYLVARSLPIFEASGVALTVTLVVGLTTALVGGIQAVVQYDIKKVLAYSTISQLGYMFIALGAGSQLAGLYHLVTHAFFKSLLFLGAGAIIHACHTQDMREMGALRKSMPITTIVFTVGTLALAGIFPLSGFWSKDEILTVLAHEHHYVAFGLALLAALITAFYCARLWFRVFAGESHNHHAHEADAKMLAPMVLLAAITLVIGFATPMFATFLGHEGEWPAIAMAASSSAVAVAGLLAGWWAFGLGKLDTAKVKAQFAWAYALVANKFYFDAVYEAVFVRGFVKIATLLWRFDGSVVDAVVNGAARLWRQTSEYAWAFDGSVIDGAVNGAASAVKSGGARARRLQTGQVQAYQRFVLGAAIALVLLLVLVKGA